VKWKYLPSPLSGDNASSRFFDIVEEQPDENVVIHISRVEGEDTAKALVKAHNESPGTAVDVDKLVLAVSTHFFHGQQQPQLRDVVINALEAKNAN
jgi:alpha/beta superfamily hydrolase